MTVIEGIKVIDADTHISEPADLWTSRVSSRWGDLVPHVRWDPETRMDRWWWAGQPSQGIAHSAVAGWKEDFPSYPSRLEDADAGSWDAVERLKRMDEYGIHAQVIYPNIGGFGSAKFLALGEPELMLACVRAYNDFLADWSAAAPDRFIPIMALPFWDLEASLLEVQRCADLGHKGILATGEPDRFGQPVLADPYWDRLWALAQDLQLPINFHIGNSDQLKFESDSPFVPMRTHCTKLGVSWFLGNARHIVEVITSGICHRFPQLNFVSVESGAGWVPFVLEALDWNWANHVTWKEHPEFELKPSEYFSRQIYACFWFEEASIRAAIEILGDKNFLYESDYPHPVSMSPGPNSIAIPPNEYIEKTFAGLPRQTAERVLHDNAARIYHVT